MRWKASVCTARIGLPEGQKNPPRTAHPCAVCASWDHLPEESVFPPYLRDSNPRPARQQQLMLVPLADKVWAGGEHTRGNQQFQDHAAPGVPQLFRILRKQGSGAVTRIRDDLANQSLPSTRKPFRPDVAVCDHRVRQTLSGQRPIEMRHDFLGPGAVHGILCTSPQTVVDHGVGTTFVVVDRRNFPFIQGRSPGQEMLTCPSRGRHAGHEPPGTTLFPSGGGLPDGWWAAGRRGRR